MKHESNNDAMSATGRILHLTLKRKWYDMIASGEKTEEYREIKPYWTTRLKDFLVKRPFDYIIFKNGYGKDVPTMKVELKNIDFGTSNLKWADREEKCYVLHLGKVVWNKIKKEQNLQKLQQQALNIPVVMPRISHFIDENGNYVDVSAGGVNVLLKRDGTHEYFKSYGFAGRMELSPVYV